MVVKWTIVTICLGELVFRCMYSYQKILFNFSNIFFRHMWIANIRARNSKNASQASLLRNLWTSYLQVENWQNLTTASFISCAKNYLVFLFRSQKINTIQDIQKNPDSLCTFFSADISHWVFRLPHRILIFHINSEALPITYSVCCVFVELVD